MSGFSGHVNSLADFSADWEALVDTQVDSCTSTTVSAAPCQAAPATVASPPSLITEVAGLDSESANFGECFDDHLFLDAESNASASDSIVIDTDDNDDLLAAVTAAVSLPSFQDIYSIKYQSENDFHPEQESVPQAITITTTKTDRLPATTLQQSKPMQSVSCSASPLQFVATGSPPSYGHTIVVHKTSHQTRDAAYSSTIASDSISSSSSTSFSSFTTTNKSAMLNTSSSTCLEDMVVAGPSGVPSLPAVSTIDLSGTLNTRFTTGKLFFFSF